ncbi:hypothetical protein DTL42_10270 [Bremerella cremea]|uniref:Uncharacterized protein n=1 Tax=Bremerella cremea TaxID=1031537 RepID=A0A368KRQ3_9BACT|nr:hypothetical protein [Bremerella cremea]RCS50494.1 hypothetical protein DTL42_10270 [Bremerella cremea]
MARFLKALQGLQALEPVTHEKSPEVEDVSAEMSFPHEHSAFLSSDQAEREEVTVPAQTMVMAEEDRHPSPALAAEKDELVKKLAQQLASVLKQRDTVAQEMLQVRDKLESNEQRHGEEIVLLQQALQVHERSAKAIEAELRQQLSRQQEEFVQRLGELERQMQEHAERPLPAIPEIASEAELREFQNDLRQQMVREQEVFLQRLAEIEKWMGEQGQAAAKQDDQSLGDNEAKLAAMHVELQKQIARQQEEFARRIAHIEKQVRQSAVLPTKSESREQTTEPTRRRSGAGELFRSHSRSREAEKTIPNATAIRQAIASLNNPPTAKEFDELAQVIFGAIDFQHISDPAVIYFGTCLPGQTTSNLVLGLAAWLSQHACDVLVIDGTLRKKELTTQLGLSASPGLFEFVRRETYRQDGTYRHPDTGIAFIPAGKSSFTLTAGEADFTSLSEQLVEIIKTYPMVLIAGEGPDLSASWLLAQVAMKTYLQATLGQVSAEEVQAAVDCYMQIGVEPTGLIATNARK